MATFWEIATRSVSNLFSLYFVYLFYLFISCFGFKSGICLLIAPVPVHCFSITFQKYKNDCCVELFIETHFDSEYNGKMLYFPYCGDLDPVETGVSGEGVNSLKT